MDARGERFLGTCVLAKLRMKVLALDTTSVAHAIAKNWRLGRILRLPQADGHPAKETSHWKATDYRPSQTDLQPKQATSHRLGRRKFFGGFQGDSFSKMSPWRFYPLSRWGEWRPAGIREDSGWKPLR